MTYTMTNAFFSCVLLLSGALHLSAAAQRPGHAPRTIAITFDDLPATNTAAGTCDAAAIIDLNQRLLDALERHDVPAAGFVSEGHVCEDIRKGTSERVLNMWLDNGHVLGNHTFSHHDIDHIPVAAYLADLERGGLTAGRLMRERGDSLRYFRPPLLHTGDDPDTRGALFDYLRANGYVLAPVTIDNQEWVFESVYRRAKQRKDAAVMKRVSDAYIPYLATVMEHFEGWSDEVVGYEPAQILLLHANEINADHFGRVAEMLRGRGYRFVTLEQALTDPAYALEDGYTGPRGLSWVHRWALGKGISAFAEEPREPSWLSELNTSY